MSEVRGATLWGFGKAVALEHPELRVRLVDVEDDAEVEAEWRNGDDEQLTAWRGGERYTARLARTAEPAAGRPKVVADGCYVVAGAFGGLGMLTAEWLAEQGAGELLLIGGRARTRTRSRNCAAGW